ncbi:hypothetical protein pb186bvf_000840 [Paramecium bursaria]
MKKNFSIYFIMENNTTNEEFLRLLPQAELIEMIENNQFLIIDFAENNNIIIMEQLLREIYQMAAR